MPPIAYSQARERLADIYETALEHWPTVIERRRAEPAVLIGQDDLRRLLAQFEFAPEVLFDGPGVAIWLPELAIWGRGASYDEAVDDLLDEIDELLAQLASNPRLRSAPNVIDRLPWVFRLLDAGSDDARKAMLFAARRSSAPDGPEPAVPQATPAEAV